MAWTVNFEPRALAEFHKLDRSAQKRMVKFLATRMAGKEDPRRIGKALKGAEVELWRYRVGDYRMICNIQDAERAVLVLRVAHRKEVYR